MRTADEFRSMEFSKSAVGGFKQSEVTACLDEAADTIEALTRQKVLLESKLTAAQQQYEQQQLEAGSIQSVLINAQKLADSIVQQANDNAQSIVEQADRKASAARDEGKAIIRDAENHAAAIRTEAEKEASNILSAAVKKSEAMIAAAHDSVARQQLLFDKLKGEIIAFKNEILSVYKKQIELLGELPDEVPFDAKRAAEASAFSPDDPPVFLDTQPKTTQAEPQPPAADGRTQVFSLEQDEEEN